MSQINYLILVHKNLEQLRRLIAALDAPWCNFFIHVDKKADAFTIKKIVPESSRVHYVADENRVDGVWGDLSLVDAALACMRLMLLSGATGHAVLLSGQDFPLRNPAYIRDFFAKNFDKDFMSVYPIPDPKKVSENGGAERFISYTFDCRNKKNPRMKAKIQPLSLRLKTIVGFARLLRYRREILPLAVKLYFKKRVYPNSLSKHFNEFWCALTKESVEKIVHAFDSNPEIREYYKYTHIPDETAFSSILLSTPQYEDKLLPMCHYIDWNANCAGSPKTLTCDDLDAIKRCMRERPYIMFARKFDEESKILDEIESLMGDAVND